MNAVVLVRDFDVAREEFETATHPTPIETIRADIRQIGYDPAKLMVRAVSP